MKQRSERKKGWRGVRAGFVFCCLQAAFLACFAVSAARAQRSEIIQLGDPEPVYRNIGTAQGLPSSETYYVIQDRSGYVWIATDRGVARYDGYRMKVFTKKDGLPDNVIFKMYEDPKGRIWFLSFNGLLSYYERGKIRLYKYNNLIRKYLGDETQIVKSLIIDDKDNFYYAVHKRGMIRISSSGKMEVLHTEKNTRLVARKYAGKWMVSIHASRPGKSDYAMNVSGIYEVDIFGENGRRKRIREYFFPMLAFNLSEYEGQAYMHVEKFVYDVNRAKELYRGTRIITIKHYKNELFAGMYRNGVRFDRLDLPENDPRRFRYFLKEYSVTSIMRDSEGGYWFSTLEKGLFYTPSLSVNCYDARQGLTNLNVACITGLKDRIFVSCEMGALDFGPPVTKYTIDEFRVKPIAIASGNKVFFPYHNGKSAKVMKDAPIVFAPSIRDGIPYKGGIIGCMSNITKFGESGEKEIIYDVSDLRPEEKGPTLQEAIIRLEDGRLLIGDLNGVMVLKNGRFRKVGGENTLFRERVADFLLHPQLGLVVATRGKGCYTLDRNLKIRQVFDTRNGLPSDLTTCTFLDDAGTLYIGTNKGVAVFDVRNGKPVLRSLLTTAQGLNSDEIRSMYIYDNKAWIAAKDGINVVDMKQLPKAGHSNIRLASLTFDNKTYDDCQPPTHASTDVSYIRISLRTENYRGTRMHRFRYRLRDEGEWQTTGNPDIELNEPRWGDYHVMISFLNDQGKWSVPKELVHFSVDPPFYVTWYFITGLMGVVLGLIYLIFRVRIRQINRRNNLQKTINQLEQKALRAQMNPHFIFNSLNSIQSFLIYEENEKAEKYLLRFAQLIRQTLNNSRETYITIDAEIQTLERYLELEQMRFREKFTFRIVSNLSPEERLYGVPPMLIQPFVENAVLHGFKNLESGGLIEVRFEELKNNRLLCIVDDNGIGRKATFKQLADGHKSFGTKITEERLGAFRQKYGDDFSIETVDKEENDKATGTTVVMKIPVVLPQELKPADES